MCEYSADIKLEHVNPLLKDYEILIRTLSEQLEFYKEEQNHLKSEVINLLDENKLLSSNIKELLDGSENAINSISHLYSESDYVENLKSQINLLLTEKETAVELWRNSLSTVDQLEEELKLFEGRSHGYISRGELKKMKLDYEKQLKELEMELIKSKSSLLKMRKSSKSVIEMKNSELLRASETHENTLKEVQRLEADVRKLQQEQEKIIGMRTEMMALIEDKNKVIGELRLRDSESKAKVNEAIQVVEVALMEKDSALLRENLAKDELSKISKALTDVVDGTNEKLKTELEGTKKQYHDKLLKIKSDMKLIIDQLQNKDAELEKHKSMSKLLSDEMDRMRKLTIHGDGNELPKMIIVEKNLETTFDKLLNSERRNLQLEAENKRMKEDLEKITRDHKSDIDKREKEKAELMTKVSSLQVELDCSTNNLREVAGKVEDVNNKISQIEAEFTKQIGLKDLQAHEIMLTKIKEVEEENAKANDELKSQLESQINFNQKWKTEVRVITQNLEDHIHHLRSESLHLKQTNEELNEKLLLAEKQVELYQDYLQRFCLDISSVVASTKEQNHSGQK